MTVKVAIYHKQPEGYVPPGLIHVANVEFPGEDHEHALEHAFERTQNIEGSWSRSIEIDGRRNHDYSAQVERLAPLPVFQGRTYGLRSSSVGDVFVIGDEAYRVAGMGFERCEVPA